ncbi:MAG: hypothetical protein GY774_04750 [Planctomycetes bacterium]|nr:hypothetical protein [Planctomycetota bacterium]
MNSIRLYKKDVRGGLRLFQVDWVKGLITTTWGLKDGDLQASKEYISIAKASRTITEQTESRVNSIIQKKLDKGYVHSMKDAMANQATNQLNLPLPMLAMSLKKVRKIESPLVVQYKYNGQRCLIAKRNGELIAYSRNGKQIETIPEILDSIKLSEGQIIDGELYRHGWKFQKIESMIKRRQKETQEVQFIAYDMISSQPYSKRLEALRHAVDGVRAVLAPALAPQGLDFLIDLVAAEAASEVLLKGMKPHFEAAIGFGFEGLIVRQGNSGYECGKRSHSLIKIKEFHDEEFLVVDITRSSLGAGILHCITKDGRQFRVTAPGTMAQKNEILRDKVDYIGRKVNVSFAEWTIDKLPFHPVANFFRNKESE